MKKKLLRAAISRRRKNARQPSVDLWRPGPAIPLWDNTWKTELRAHSARLETQAAPKKRRFALSKLAPLAKFVPLGKRARRKKLAQTATQAAIPATKEHFLDRLEPALFLPPAPADFPLAWQESLAQLAASNPGTALKFDRVRATYPALHAALLQIGAGSPWLTVLGGRHSKDLVEIVISGAQASYDGIMRDLQALNNELADSNPLPNLATLKQQLRQLKRRTLLTIALADVSATWAFPNLMEKWSAAASLLTQTAFTYAIRSQLPQQATGTGARTGESNASGIALLALGKLGANELNYSSDIDLIAIHDPHVLSPDNPERATTIAVRIVRTLIDILEQKTADGYVFRTDFRIRPSPSYTPLSLQIESAITYYENVARTWERAAFIRARPLAGDTAMAQGFLDHIAGFVWRGHLDYAALADLREVRTLMTDYKALSMNPDGDLLGYDLKINPGGIREIEFSAQVLQLIWGGRNHHLRLHSTLPTLAVLSRLQLMVPEDAAFLSTAYVLLRTIEHRIQLVADQHTHSLPSKEADFRLLAEFCGFSDGDALQQVLSAVLVEVHRIQQGIFMVSGVSGAGDMPQLARDGGGGKASPPEDGDNKSLHALAAWETFGAHALQGREIVDAWFGDNYRAFQTARAHQLVRVLVPELLAAIAEANTDHDPAIALAALQSLDRFFTSLPSSVSLLSLFAAHPPVLRSLVMLLLRSKLVAQLLARSPMVIEMLLDPQPFSVEVLEASLDRQPDLETQLDVIHRWGHEERFRCSAQFVLGQFAWDTCTQILTGIAETLLAAIMRVVLAEFSNTYGTIPGARMAVMGFGKLGSYELMPQSDLDIVLVTHVEGDPRSEGGSKSIGHVRYFNTFAARIVSALELRRRDSDGYACDMRLRPYGKASGMAVPFSGFERYYATDARLWEFLALARARVITDIGGLAPDLERARRHALAHTHAQSAAEIRAEVAHMRARIAQTYPDNDPTNFKYSRGGTVDIDFIAQGLLLAHLADSQAAEKLSSVPSSTPTMLELVDLPSIDRAILMEAYNIAMRGALEQQILTVPTTTQISDAQQQAVRRIFTQQIESVAF